MAEPPSPRTLTLCKPAGYTSSGIYLKARGAGCGPDSYRISRRRDLREGERPKAYEELITGILFCLIHRQF